MASLGITAAHVAEAKSSRALVPEGGQVARRRHRSAPVGRLNPNEMSIVGCSGRGVTVDHSWRSSSDDGTVLLRRQRWRQAAPRVEGHGCVVAGEHFDADVVCARGQVLLDPSQDGVLVAERDEGTYEPFAQVASQVLVVEPEPQERGRIRGYAKRGLERTSGNPKRVVVVSGQDDLDRGREEGAGTEDAPGPGGVLDRGEVCVRRIRATTAYRYGWMIERYINPTIGQYALRSIRTETASVTASSWASIIFDAAIHA
jgi:hypothetical protein